MLLNYYSNLTLKKAAYTLLGLLLFRILLGFLPFQIQNNFLYTLYSISISLIVACLFLILIAYMKRQTGSDRYLVMIFSGIGFVISILGVLLSILQTPYDDGGVIFQSLDNPNEKIIYQESDLVSSSDGREVHIIEYTKSFRYCKSFKQIKLKGNWIQLDFYPNKTDTTRFKNYIYTSETNRRR